MRSSLISRSILSLLVMCLATVLTTPSRAVDTDLSLFQVPHKGPLLFPVQVTALSATATEVTWLMSGFVVADCPPCRVYFDNLPAGAGDWAFEDGDGNWSHIVTLPIGMTVTTRAIPFDFWDFPGNVRTITLGP